MILTQYTQPRNTRNTGPRKNLFGYMLANVKQKRWSQAFNPQPGWSGLSEPEMTTLSTLPFAGQTLLNGMRCELRGIQAENIRHYRPPQLLQTRIDAPFAGDLLRLK